MAKKRYKHKLTHGNETAGLIAETSCGMLLKFPLTLPNSHIQFTFSGNKLSGHLTKEGPEKSYPERFEIDLGKTDFNKKMSDLNIESFLTKFSVTSLPGRIYLGGFFHPLLTSICPTDSRETVLEEFMAGMYFVRRHELSQCKDKIWIAYNRADGALGKWYNIGLVFGTLENNECFYMAWTQMNELSKQILTPLFLPIERSIVFPKKNAFLIFTGREKTKLVKNGQRLRELLYKKIGTATFYCISR